MKSKEVFQKGMGLLQATFPDKALDLDVYWELLGDIDDGVFLLAIKDLCSTTREIYPNTNMIALIREKGMSRNKLTAGEAWAVVLGEVSRTGSYGYPRFDDPIVAKAVDCIGWRTICLSTMIGVERSHFIKVYDQLKERDHNERVALPEVTEGFKELANNVAKKLMAPETRGGSE